MSIEPDGTRLRVAAERFLATGALERSLPLHRLFEFLLACTLEGRMPREIDVAQELLGRTSGFEIGQDATIRVHIHRLRRKLEDFHLAYPDEPAFLTIPRGDYRLILHEAPPPPAEQPAVAPPGGRVPGGQGLRGGWLWALAALSPSTPPAGCSPAIAISGLRPFAPSNRRHSGLGSRSPPIRR